MDSETLGSVIVKNCNAFLLIGNGAVLMLKTIHEVGESHKIDRLRRTPRALPALQNPKDFL